mmetsp:Transcript_17243/g.34882  ORF Transcript_17243/g.34882 Transcript_17243/m.34882 type:complete len:86 (-) Transcript_17243:1272-1529(-)
MRWLRQGGREAALNVPDDSRCPAPRGPCHALELLLMPLQMVQSLLCLVAMGTANRPIGLAMPWATRKELVLPKVVRLPWTREEAE